MKRNLFLLALCASYTIYAQTGNVGINTFTPGSTLTLNGSFAATYKKVTANYTMTSTDYYLTVENAANTTITLPVVATANPTIQGRDYHIKNTGSGTVTIVANGTERFDNQSGSSITSITLASGEYVHLISTGIAAISTTTAQWEVAVVGSGQNVEPWNNVATGTAATNNTQNIYQMGNVYVGTATVPVGLSGNTKFNLTTTANPASFDRYTTGAGNFSTLFLRKSNNTTLGTNTFVPDGEGTGRIVFQGANGTDFGNLSGGSEVRGIAAGNQSATNSGSKLTFHTTALNNLTSNERMRIDENGFAGINTTSPNNNLVVRASAASNGIAIDYNANNINSQILNFRRGRGTEAVPTGSGFGDALGAVNFSPYDGTTYTPSASFRAQASENQGTGELGTELQWWTTPVNSATMIKRATLTEAGNLGIGTATPTATVDVVGSFSANIRTLTTGTVADNDYTVLVGGNISLPAPSATNTRRIYYLVNNSATSRTITGTFKDAGNGAAAGSFILTNTAEGKAITVQSDGTAWWIISRN
ncbi:hypothetical protein N0B16_06730 [Chryseobacterium sp. GMJ5]|uniref:Uncharacterized protein n=1 Tax=Chryseobacterium gilvum TaxID=2976534 RepID=A0ABT2VVV1_9FLAO|nr:hypothetical protein [Chryseobacterium gilvum]MCU7614128.1 hypothetical protein [Chryseobacterium gilvum]